MTNSMRLSKSAIQTYEICPLKYKYSYVDKLPQPEALPMVRGKLLHTFFENFNKYVGTAGVGRGFLANNLVDLQKLNDPEIANHIINFFTFNEKVLDKLGKEQFKPIAVEQKYYDAEWDVVGVIDAVYKKGDDILILDYKTGKYNENSLSEYRFELALYTVLWDKFNPSMPGTHWGIFFSENGVIWTEARKKISISAMYKKVERNREAILAKRFEPRYSNICLTCGFKNKCFK